MKPVINPEHLAQLASIYSKIKELPRIGFDDDYTIYPDGRLAIYSKDDYKVGEFYMEDDFWLFEVGEDE